MVHSPQFTKPGYKRQSVTMSGRTRKGSKTKTTNTRKRKTAAASAIAVQRVKSREQAEESERLLLEEEPELLNLFPIKSDEGVTGKNNKGRLEHVHAVTAVSTKESTTSAQKRTQKGTAHVAEGFAGSRLASNRLLYPAEDIKQTRHGHGHCGEEDKEEDTRDENQCVVDDVVSKGVKERVQSKESKNGSVDKTEQQYKAFLLQTGYTQSAQSTKDVLKRYINKVLFSKLKFITHESQMDTMGTLATKIMKDINVPLDTQISYWESTRRFVNYTLCMKRNNIVSSLKESYMSEYHEFV